MIDIDERLRDWYAEIDDEPVEAALIATSIRRGTRTRRMRYGTAATAVVVCVAVIAAAVVSRHSNPKHVNVAVTTPSTQALLPEATVAEFPDLELIRAWVAENVTRSVSRPDDVRAQIVHTTLRALLGASQEGPAAAPTPVDAVQLTGARFTNPFSAPTPVPAEVMLVAWNPALRYPSSLLTARDPIDLTRFGRVYALPLGHPSVPAPRGPTCGQHEGPVRTISPIGRLDHDVLAGGAVLVPPGTAQPRLSAAQAIRIAASAQPLSHPLAAKVSARLALQNGLANSLEPGQRLVWIFTADSVPIFPEIGVGSCGRVNVIVDATTGQELSQLTAPGL